MTGQRSAGGWCSAGGWSGGKSGKVRVSRPVWVEFIGKKVVTVDGHTVDEHLNVTKGDG